INVIARASCMETRLDHRRSACSNFINKVRSRPAIDEEDIELIYLYQKTFQYYIKDCVQSHRIISTWMTRSKMEHSLTYCNTMDIPHHY
ncbi:hypothetical protein ACSZOK_19450, partial [Aeromonas veronii]|uniref:hypothetical protein n=1 Tax=Aeromonas veronii TaxID=654 RepID=UPI003EC6C58D